MFYEWIASDATVCSRPVSLDASFCFEGAFLCGRRGYIILAYFETKGMDLQLQFFVGYGLGWLSRGEELGDVSTIFIIYV